MEYDLSWVGILVESLNHYEINCETNIFIGEGGLRLTMGAKNSHKRSSVKRITSANSVRRKLYLQYISGELQLWRWTPLQFPSTVSLIARLQYIVFGLGEI